MLIAVLIERMFDCFHGIDYSDMTLAVDDFRCRQKTDYSDNNNKRPKKP